MRRTCIPHTEQAGVAITRHRRRSKFARAVRFLIDWFSWT